MFEKVIFVRLMKQLSSKQRTRFLQSYKWLGCTPVWRLTLPSTMWPLWWTGKNWKKKPFQFLKEHNVLPTWLKSCWFQNFEFHINQFIFLFQTFHRNLILPWGINYIVVEIMSCNSKYRIFIFLMLISKSVPWDQMARMYQRAFFFQVHGYN